MLTDCLPGKHQNNLHILMIHEQEKPLQLYMSETGDPVQIALGILTSKPLPNAMVCVHTFSVRSQFIITVSIVFHRFPSSVCMMETRFSVLNLSPTTAQLTYPSVNCPS